ncbi:hypothetical protein K443DRAFT_85528 [Laccaria amethystina LaAM-08-1]|uniref:Replication protein A C-terminal domain-containing protein n=1 Tax=Laccaria amethystina LaAM-08-1 TaxID=1095629 RepID=A0A0C9X7T6_9AGAR|nr:hypothetical protein K443DRAFT_85528 [Laccaria amethystina LaAM-08-1]
MVEAGADICQAAHLSAQVAARGAREAEASHSLRPLTVAQLNKATQAHTDAEWQVDGMEIGQVTIVGHVSSIQAQTTNCVYVIDDGTGRIEARHWSAFFPLLSLQFINEISEKTYVRVTGGLKTFGSKRYINTTHIRPSKDPHEVYFHILEAITVTLTLERGPPPGPGQTQQPRGTDSTMASYTNPSAAISDEYSHRPKLEQDICRFIAEQPANEAGIHVAAIARAVGGGGDAHRISDALDKLMDDGLVFTTIDDSHFNLSR